MIVYNLITIFIHTLILLLIYPYLVRYENKGNTEDHRKQFFLFLHTSKLQQKVKQQIFPLGTFSMFFFFHFQKFQWKMFRHRTLTGHRLNNPERHSEEAIVKC